MIPETTGAECATFDHSSENVQTIVKAYLDMLLNDFGYAGFRYDMVKGYSGKFTGIYNDCYQT